MPLPRAGKSIFSLQHVNSRHSVSEWRSEGVLSEGASEELFFITPRPVHARADRKGTSYVSSLVEDLLWAIGELNNGNRPKNVQQVEEWAIFLHGILTHETRAYHGIAHVFKICAAASPLQLVSAFFRDTISHYIDGLVLDPRQEELLKGVFEPGTLILSQSLASSPRDMAIVQLFGYELGMDLSRFRVVFEGLDIFLSSLLAHRLLKDAVDLRHVVQIATCLEATIPFRKAIDGIPPMDRLFERLQAVNTKYDLNFTHEEMVRTIQQAVDLHNRSVGNMASKEMAEFMDHTWRLLPEQHSPLRQHALYTLADYYKAIESMVKLTAGLQPNVVFVSFQGLPSPRELSRFQDRLASNLQVSQAYLNVRLLSVSVVAALACLTGGAEAPKSFFFGDLPAFHQQTARLGDKLIEGKVSEKDKTDSPVYYLLATGEGMSDTSFDTKSAPLAAYLYRELGATAIKEALKHCGKVPMTDESAWTLLRDYLPRTVVEQVAQELARVAISRRGPIDKLLQEL